jgi:hypothetical protein
MGLTIKKNLYRFAFFLQFEWLKQALDYFAALSDPLVGADSK